LSQIETQAKRFRTKIAIMKRSDLLPPQPFDDILKQYRMALRLEGEIDVD
jgi:hypothetical protein